MLVFKRSKPLLLNIYRIMNQQEQIAQGSLRSSHRNTHAVIFKKTNDTDKYVEIANTSHNNGELKFTHNDPN